VGSLATDWHLFFTLMCPGADLPFQCHYSRADTKMLRRFHNSNHNDLLPGRTCNYNQHYPSTFCVPSEIRIKAYHPQRRWAGRRLARISDCEFHYHHLTRTVPESYKTSINSNTKRAMLDRKPHNFFSAASYPLILNKDGRWNILLRNGCAG
jgi:hypothetical protein